jgi:hypothetical protein
MMARRLLVCAALVLFLLGITPPASADPATPTNYRSTVESIDPTVGFTAEIVGGDAFVRLTSVPGFDLVVLGYEGEPYMWFRPDGTVAVNQRSPATYLNDDRYAAVTLPPDADADAEPLWETVASSGRWSWHDHRTHWMARSVPGVVAEAQAAGDETGDVPIFDWTLPLIVNGEDGAIAGRLVWTPTASVVPWAILAVASAVLVLVVGLRRSRLTLAAVTVTAAAAVVVGIGAFVAQPTDVRTVGVDLIGPIIALLLSTYALWRAGGNAAAALRFGVVAAAALGAWAVLRIGVLTYPLLPTMLPSSFDRFVTALSLGVAAGAIGGLLVASGRGQADGRSSVADPVLGPHQA